MSADPELPFTAEEQAVWDRLAFYRWSRGVDAACCYELTKGAAMDLVLARRAALADELKTKTTEE